MQWYGFQKLRSFLTSLLKPHTEDIMNISEDAFSAGGPALNIVQVFKPAAI
jgi:hypothetical protein